MSNILSLKELSSIIDIIGADDVIENEFIRNDESLNALNALKAENSLIAAKNVSNSTGYVPVENLIYVYKKATKVSTKANRYLRHNMSIHCTEGIEEDPVKEALKEAVKEAVANYEYASNLLTCFRQNNSSKFNGAIDID